VIPRYVVPRFIFEEAVENKPHFGWFLGVRDITNATNERTCIAFVYPRLGSFDTIRNMTPTIGDPELVSAFLANLNSFVFDFFARQKLSGTHFTFSYSKQVPIVHPEEVRASKFDGQTSVASARWFSRRVLELTYTAWDLEAFARDCSWSGPPFRWDEERRFLLRCELDAAFFHIYLSSTLDGQWKPARIAEGAVRDETPEELAELKRHFPTPRNAVSYIMDTFPIVKRKDEEKWGEYRTKRVILEIYDAMAEAMRTGKPYQTRLDPPPADPRCCHPPRETK
jgi:hypothetical protein